MEIVYPKTKRKFTLLKTLKVLQEYSLVILLGESGCRFSAQLWNDGMITHMKIIRD